MNRGKDRQKSKDDLLHKERRKKRHRKRNDHNRRKEDKNMTTIIQVRSARDCDQPINGKLCVQEISYRVTTDDGHFDSAARFELEGVDVDGDGFIDDPDLAGLVTLITKHLTEAAGAEGCPNALSTIEKQIKDKKAASGADQPAGMVDRSPEGIGISDDDSDDDSDDTETTDEDRT